MPDTPFWVEEYARQVMRRRWEVAQRLRALRRIIRYLPPGKKETARRSALSACREALL